MAAGELVTSEAKYSTVFEKFAAKKPDGESALKVDKTEYGSFGVIGVILFFFYILPSYAKGQGWTG